MRSLRKHTSRYFESLLNESSDSSKLPGRDLIPQLLLSKSDILYTFLSVGFPGSILFLMPSSPAATMAENARYGFADGSGALHCTFCFVIIPLIHWHSYNSRPITPCPFNVDR